MALADIPDSDNGDRKTRGPYCAQHKEHHALHPERCACSILPPHPQAEHPARLAEHERLREEQEQPEREARERATALEFRAFRARRAAEREREQAPITRAIGRGFEALAERIVAALPAKAKEPAAATTAEPAKPPATEEIVKSFLTPAGVLRAQPKPKARFESTHPTINKAARGGLPTGALVVIQGPPDSGKTGDGLQDAVKIATEAEAVTVVFTPDQGREASAVRIGALLGLSAEKLEERDEAELRRLDEMLQGRNILLPDDSEEAQTVEAVIAAGETIRPDLPHVLFLDSLQEARPTTQTGTGTGNNSERERVIANVRLCQAAAKSATAWLVIATSQTTKASSSGDPRNRPPKIAAAAESFKIAFAAQLIVHLEGDPAQGPDFGRGTVVKNKLGGPKLSFGLRLDPATTRLEEIDGAEADRQRDESASREREKAISKLADQSLALLIKHGPLNVAAIQERVGGRKADLLAALAGLEAQGAATWKRGPRNSHVWEAVRRAN